MGAQDYGGSDMTGKTKSAAWTDKEIEILNSTYPDFGMRGALLALPNRTKVAIESKCRDLQIRANRPRQSYVLSRKDQWTSEEMKILRENFPKVGPSKMMRLLPGRSEAAIAKMAYKFNLKLVKMKDLRPGEESKEQDDPFARKSIQVLKRAGSWKADIPAIRSVFDLAEAA